MPEVLTKDSDTKSETKSTAYKPRHKGGIFTTKKDYGPWRKRDPELGGRPNVFTYDEFCKLMAVPIKNQKGDKIDPAIAPADQPEYFDDLIDRGLVIGAIAFTPDAIPTPTPLGPGNSTRITANPIRESTAAHQAAQKDPKTVDAFMKPVLPSI
jgi:hypothetical protein